MNSNGHKEKPILFSGPMVRAILEGRKTQTRRVVKPQPEYRENASVPGAYGTFTKGGWNLDHPAVTPTDAASECPYGKPGDRLWVRESFRQSPGSLSVHYKADTDEVSGGPWKPSIFMPRWLSRITLEITNVRVERLQQIPLEDAQSEGIDIVQVEHANQYWREETLRHFITGWDSLNAKRGYGWESNPFVWVLSFRRVD